MEEEKEEKGDYLKKIDETFPELKRYKNSEEIKNNSHLYACFETTILQKIETSLKLLEKKKPDPPVKVEIRI